MRLALCLAVLALSGCFQKEYSWAPDEFDPDTNPVMQQLERDAEAGDLDAQFNVAYIRHIRYGDPRQAFPVFERLAAEGHAQSAKALAWAYMQGEGISVDHDKAARWLRRAAALGDSEAARSVAAYEANTGAHPEGPVLRSAPTEAI